MKVRAPLLAIVSLVLLVHSCYAQAQVSFFQPPTFAGGTVSGLATPFVADFNGDGKLDILTPDGTLNLGNGDGTFKKGQSVSGNPQLVADFNGDGKPDILEEGTGTLAVLLGNGDGTFQAPISTPSGAALVSIAAFDLNGDHKADVVGVWNATLYVYISNGDGTFKAGVPYSSGISSNVSVVLSFGDFNNDQKVDVALSTSGITTVGQEVVMLGNGDGTFQSATKTSAGVYFPSFAVVGDFNGDGKMDVALSSSGSASTTSVPPAVYVLMGNGDGTFQTPMLATNSSLLTTSYAALLGVADLNGDGKLDLIVEPISDVAQVYLGNGDGTFTNTRTYQFCLPPYQHAGTGGGTGGLAVADFNSDGKPDIAGCNAVLLGNGNGTFQGWQVEVIPDSAGSVIVGRFDKNGGPGVAVLSNTNVYILNNDGTGTLSLVHSYTIQPNGSGMVAADFNGDGNLDLVVIEQNGSTWSYSVLLGNGDGSFQAPVPYPQGNPSSAIGPSAVVADFNGDHKPDFAVAGFSSGTLGIFLGNGDGTFAAPVSYFDADFGPLIVADFNGDGKLDIAASGMDSTDTIKTIILLGNGDGTFQAGVLPSSLNTFRASFTADVNSDGKPDLIGANNQVALGNGDGTFTLLPQLPCPSGLPCGIGAVADLNGDGRPDLFVLSGELQIFQSAFQLGNGDGSFAPAIPFPTNGWVPLASIADMNGDGRPDLIFMWSMPAPYGSIGATSGVGLILNVTAPDFTIGPASGSSTSQTVSAGQTASFKLDLWAIASFSGTVNLSCAIAPIVTPAPTCNLSISSVQINSTTSPTVTINVGTTATVTTSAAPRMGLPPGAMLSMFILSGLTVLIVRGRKSLPALATPALAIVLALSMSCGGGTSGSGTSHHTTPGTPSGTYTATVTVTAGTMSHNMALTVVVK